MPGIVHTRLDIFFLNSFTPDARAILNRIKIFTACFFFYLFLLFFIPTFFIPLVIKKRWKSVSCKEGKTTGVKPKPANGLLPLYAGSGKCITLGVLPRSERQAPIEPRTARTWQREAAAASADSEYCSPRNGHPKHPYGKPKYLCTMVLYDTRIYAGYVDAGLAAPALTHEL